MKLIGHVKGVEISFDFHPPNIYKAIIPKQFDGVYIVNLKAIDDAGNENNYADMIVCIDFDEMSFKVLENNLKYIINDEKYGYLELDSKYTFKVIDGEVVSKCT